MRRLNDHGSPLNRANPSGASEWVVFALESLRNIVHGPRRLHRQSCWSGDATSVLTYNSIALGMAHISFSHMIPDGVGAGDPGSGSCIPSV